MGCWSVSDGTGRELAKLLLVMGWSNAVTKVAGSNGSLGSTGTTWFGGVGAAMGDDPSEGVTARDVWGHVVWCCPVHGLSHCQVDTQCY